jgi:hypothetical protein
MADTREARAMASRRTASRQKFSASNENLADAHELEFVVTECIKKMLASASTLNTETLPKKNTLTS